MMTTAITATSVFVEDVLNGKATVENIADYIEYWHKNDTDCCLQSFLGFTDEESEFWLTADDATALPEIVNNHRSALKTAPAVVKKREPVWEPHTFFLPAEEYNRIHRLLALDVDTARTDNEASGYIQTSDYPFAVRKLPNGKSLELYLRFNGAAGLYVEVLFRDGGDAKTTAAIKDLTTSRVSLAHADDRYDVGIDVAPEHATVCDMFDAAEKASSYEMRENEVLAMLNWPKELSACGVVAQWLNRQRALYLYVNEKMWFSYNGNDWQPCGFENRMDGTMVTVCETVPV